MPLPLKERTTSVPIHNAVSNVVAEVLIDRPKEKMQIKEVYDIVESLYPKRYTPGQVRRGLEWQSQNNDSYIKTQNTGQKNRTRLYWYDPVGDI